MATAYVTRVAGPGPTRKKHSFLILAACVGSSSPTQHITYARYSAFSSLPPFLSLSLSGLSEVGDGRNAVQGASYPSDRTIEKPTSP